MPSSSDFIRLERTPSTRGINDNFSVTESDRESTLPSDQLEQSSSKDYWLGKKYLEINIAEKLLRASREEESFANFDVRLDAEMRDFPYATCWIVWQAHGIARGVSIPEGLPLSNVLETLTAIGMTIRTGSDLEKKIVFDEIRVRCNSAGLGREEDLRDHNPELGRERRSHTDENEAARQDEHDTLENRDISRYSMALKEFGDLEDEMPCYNIRPNTSASGGFTAQLTFHGVQVRASGRTKKTAQHQAAKNACAMLHINPW